MRVSIIHREESQGVPKEEVHIETYQDFPTALHIHIYGFNANCESFTIFVEEPPSEQYILSLAQQLLTHPIEEFHPTEVSPHEHIENQLQVFNSIIYFNTIYPNIVRMPTTIKFDYNAFSSWYEQNQGLNEHFETPDPFIQVSWYKRSATGEWTQHTSHLNKKLIGIKNIIEVDSDVYYVKNKDSHLFILPQQDEQGRLWGTHFHFISAKMPKLGNVIKFHKTTEKETGPLEGKQQSFCILPLHFDIVLNKDGSTSIGDMKCLQDKSSYMKTKYPTSELKIIEGIMLLPFMSHYKKGGGNTKKSSSTKYTSPNKHLQDVLNKFHITEITATSIPFKGRWHYTITVAFVNEENEPMIINDHIISSCHQPDIIKQLLEIMSSYS